MRSNLASRVLGAAAGTVALEFTDRLLDRLGVKDESQVARVVARAAVSAAVSLALAKIVEQSEVKGAEEVQPGDQDRETG